MPRCPQCGKEIDHLINWCRNYEEFVFSLTDDGEPDYEWVDTSPGDENEYYCPHCASLLFTSEEDAVKFLRGDR